MQIPVLLDRSQAGSLTRQLVEQLRDAIRQGRIGPGARLPSSRQLSEQLDVSRNTVVRAYETLLADGYTESRPASGIYACRHLPDAPLRPVVDRQEPPAPATPMPGPLAVHPAQNLLGPSRNKPSFDFFPGRPNAGLFPLKTWRRLLQGALSNGGAAGLTQYGDPAGLMALRTAIAEHIAATRGIVADPGRIVVTAGIQQGIGIAARLFLAPGHRGFVESPCYQGAAFSFAATGAAVEGVAVDAYGLIPEALPERPHGLLYLTPSHQYPTGGLLTLSRRQQIVDWARRQGCHLLEDDYDGDFRYEGSPLPAIAALAPDCTIYLGTFSKSLGAGLRLGYMVLPPALAEAAIAAKTLLDNGNPWHEQAALAELIRSGSFAAHLTRVRAYYRESRDRLIEALRRHFGEVTLSGESAGLHLFWQLPPGVPEVATLEALARRRRVGVYGLASGGAWEARTSLLGRRGIVLGYAALSPRQIEQGVARLSDAIDDAIDGQPELVEELLTEEALPAFPSRPVAAASRKLAPQSRHRPALRGTMARRALSPAESAREGDGSMPVIRSIYRYPIKGLSAQPLSEVGIEAGRPIACDRVFALARPGAPIDPDEPRWAKKGLFVMLMLDEGLARVRTRLDVETMRLTVLEGNRPLLTADLEDESGRAAVEALVHRLVPALRAPPRLVRAKAGHFMDKPDSVISLINLATIRSLEAQWGVEIDPLRFRANIYIDGAKPWEEMGWVGHDIRLGGTEFRVDRRNGRCGATNVNPATGRRDLDIPASLRASFGHKDLGIYLIARESGRVAVGDRLSLPGQASARPEMRAPLPIAGPRTFICRGCYFIYEEATGFRRDGIAAGTPFAAIPGNWRCPDCGSDKATFRPHVATAA